jgi:hypothetical protein
MVHFSISKKELGDLNEARDVNALREVGGVVGLAESLQTDLKQGLNEDEEHSKYDDRIREYV